MSTFAFGTLKFAKALRHKAKLTPEQAEALSEGFAAATSAEMVTKVDRDRRLGGMRLPVASGIVGLGCVLVAIKLQSH